MRHLTTIAALFTGLVIGLSVNAPEAGTRTAHPAGSPGAIRIIQNGEWLFMETYYEAEATVNVVGCYDIKKAPEGQIGHVISMYWGPGCITYLDTHVSLSGDSPAGVSSTRRVPPKR